MSAHRFFVLFAAALLAIVGALFVSSQRHLNRDMRDVRLLPDLEAKLDSVGAVTLRRDGPKPAVTLERAARGSWTILERDHYPADLAKIRKLLLALAALKIVEEKTSNPASYPILGVEDPHGAPAGGIEVGLSVTSAGGAQLKTLLIVGHSSGSGSYVRLAGDAKSYAVSPAIEVEAAPRDWIDPKLVDLPLEKIASIRIKPADGLSYSISRSKPGDFTLDGVPAGRDALDAAALAPSPTGFGSLTAEDVASASSIDFSKPSRAEIRLFDGGLYTLTGAAIADKRWIRIEAANDPPLSARLQGRAFEIPSYRYESIFRPVEQLLRPKPAKPVKPK